MPRDPRYDILFTPIKIGPKTAKNRFYQVPHCDAMGHNKPHGDLGHRAAKAEGGWGVVCTEQCSIHPTSDAAPYGETRIWDKGHAKQLGMLVDALHRHGALAGIELCHNGIGFSNRMTREIPLAPSPHTVHYNWDPVMGRELDKEDIRELRRWQAEAAKRAASIGFDIVYVYAAHDIALPQHFLSRLKNHRTDEYGGSVENRARLIGELLEDTKNAVGDKAAVALRFAVDEMQGPPGITWEEEGQAVVEMFADLPDLWDVNISDWAYDSSTARFDPEGYQEPYVAFVKKKTTKPVLGVGRFTSPDTMVSQIERGILDIIGAARPSIADPFLPKKIEEGRLDEIRECIGCNICVASENTSGLFRCTQNPTAGEEWRCGWHPEKIARKRSDDNILVVGAGPAGLECARALGQRGYTVHLVEAAREVGGRVAFESTLPGLATWGRVRDYRQIQLGKMKNAEVHLKSKLSAEDVLDYGAEVVVLATGSFWRKDGVAYQNVEPIPGSRAKNVFTPDDIRGGKKISGPVIVFDDDHYYMGSVIAEKLKQEGADVTLVTPLPEVARWTEYTLEQPRITVRLLELGVEIVTDRNITKVGGNSVELACVYTGKTETRPCKSVVMVTSRLPNDALYKELMQDPKRTKKAGIKTLKRIGDCLSPGTIQSAVYWGHRFARELDAPAPGDVPFKLERIALEHR